MLACCLPGRFEAIKRGSWGAATFVSYCYKCDDGRVVDDSDASAERYLHLADDFKIDCPSLIFVFVPDTNKALYDTIKYVTNICGAVQSQVAVASTFGRQRNKDQ